MKTLEQLGISPYPWSLNLETCTVVDAKGRPVLDNEYGVASMEDADMNLFLECAGLYECLCEAVKEKCTECHQINDYESDIGIEWQMCKGCPVNKWRAALAKAAGESEVEK